MAEVLRAFIHPSALRGLNRRTAHKTSWPDECGRAPELLMRIEVSVKLCIAQQRALVTANNECLWRLRGRHGRAGLHHRRDRRTLSQDSRSVSHSGQLALSPNGHAHSQ